MDVSTTARGTVNGCSVTPPDASNPNHPDHTDPAPVIRTKADRLADLPHLPTNATVSLQIKKMLLPCLSMAKQHFKALVASCPPQPFKDIYFFIPLQQQFQTIVEIMRKEAFIDTPPLEARLAAMEKLLAHIDTLHKTLEAALATGKFSSDAKREIISACTSFNVTIHMAKDVLEAIGPNKTDQTR